MKQSILMTPVGAKNIRPVKLTPEAARDAIRRMLAKVMDETDASAVAEIQVSNIMRGRQYAVRSPLTGRIVQFTRIAEVMEVRHA